MVIAVIMVATLNACGPRGNSSTSINSSASNEEVTTTDENSKTDANAKSRIVDNQMTSRKTWQYQDYGNNGKLAMIYSKNSYTNDNGQLIYLGITLNKISDYNTVGGLNWMVSGEADDGNPITISFLPTVNNVTISFDGAEGETWYGVADQEHSYNLFMITKIDDFISKLKSAKKCTIDLDTEYGRFTFKFNVQNLNW